MCVPVKINFPNVVELFELAILTYVNMLLLDTVYAYILFMPYAYIGKFNLLYFKCTSIFMLIL